MAGNRAEAISFFYADDGIVPPDRVVLSCYELAKFYHVDPTIFLNQRITEIKRHIHWTNQLNEKIAEEQRAMRAESDG